MAKIWRNRLEAGTQIFVDCPKKYMKDVLKLLREDVASGNITVDRYEEITGEKYE